MTVRAPTILDYACELWQQEIVELARGLWIASLPPTRCGGLKLSEARAASVQRSLTMTSEWIDLKSSALADWRQRGITRCRHPDCLENRGCRARCRQDRRRRADWLLRHCRRPADWFRQCVVLADGLADLSAHDRSADGCPAGVADERPADPVCASRAIRQDRPSRGRGASESRTGTSPDRAIRSDTSRSVCRGTRTELCRCWRPDRPLDEGLPARSRPLARGCQSLLRRVPAARRYSKIRTLLSLVAPRWECRGWMQPSNTHVHCEFVASFK
jgi:hypothetical protein